MADSFFNCLPLFLLLILRLLIYVFLLLYHEFQFIIDGVVGARHHGESSIFSKEDIDSANIAFSKLHMNTY